MNRRSIEKAHRLLRGEQGTVFKPHDGKIRVALAYPNTYTMGMSNLGFQAVYRFWNDFPDVVCERVFLPESAEREEMERSPTSLFSLESQTPLARFDVVAFSVTFEPDELNVIRMLQLAGVPLLASERGEHHPLVVAGGPITFLNPEPLAPFMDVVAVGEAEGLLASLTEALRKGSGRAERLQSLEQEEGFYIPSHYDVRYRPEGIIGERNHRLFSRDRVVGARMGKGGDWLPPATYVLTKATEMSGKFLVEVSRGCPTLCRFCWAGYNYHPKRSFDVARILDVARQARAHTAEIGLVSTAVGAHPEIVELVGQLKAMGFRVSVSSLRFEDIKPELVDLLIASGERTLAVAPEVGSDRLRYAIHKRVPNGEILEKTDMLFARGVENLKLYLMVGLPGERQEDVAEIPRLVEAIRERMLRHARRRGRVGKLILSINPFIPKPQTPFQWSPMASVGELNQRMRFLKKALGSIPNLEVHCKSPRQECLQALLSTGDRRLAPAMLDMARGQGMGESLVRHGLDLDFYIYRARSVAEILPWDVIDNGMKKELLVSQFNRTKDSSQEPWPAYSVASNATA